MVHSDAVLDKAQELKAEGTAFVLATVVRAESPTSAKPGAKAIVTAQGELIGWIGGGCAQPAVLDTAKKALKDGQSRLIRVSPNKGGNVEEGIIDFGMTCHSGGTLDIFIDPVIARPALLIIGASPVAQTLSALAHRAGFAVHVAFPDADAEMFPDAVQIIDGLALTPLAQRVPPFLVVATQGKRDEAGLEAALQLGSPYVAFVASARKADKLKSNLKAGGLDPARVDAICAPAGVEIGAVTPEEIAVSVLAGLIQAYRGGMPVASAEASGSVAAKATGGCCASDAEVAAPAAQAGCGGEAGSPTTGVDPVCGMQVEIEGAAFVATHEGQSYWFCCRGCQQAFEEDPLQYLSARAAS
jgi:xanthine dehydrogenase accessory factor